MVHQRYFVLGKKDDENLFLTEDETYTTQLDRAEVFLSKDDTQNRINIYKENEPDEYYTGDYSIGNDIEIRKVEIIISALL